MMSYLLKPLIDRAQHARCRRNKAWLQPLTPRSSCARALPPLLALASARGTAAAITFAEAYQAALRNDPTYRMNYYENEYGKEHKHVGARRPAAFARRQLRGQPRARRRRRRSIRSAVRPYPSALHQPLGRGPAAPAAAEPRSDRALPPGAAQSHAQRSAVRSRRQRAGAARRGRLPRRAAVRTMRWRWPRPSATCTPSSPKVNARLFEKGEGTRTDMLETQAKLDQSEAQVLEAQDTRDRQPQRAGGHHRHGSGHAAAARPELQVRAAVADRLRRVESDRAGQQRRPARIHAGGGSGPPRHPAQQVPAMRRAWTWWPAIRKTMRRRSTPTPRTRPTARSACRSMSRCIRVGRSVR